MQKTVSYPGSPIGKLLLQLLPLPQISTRALAHDFFAFRELKRNDGVNASAAAPF